MSKVSSPTPVVCLVLIKASISRSNVCALDSSRHQLIEALTSTRHKAEHKANESAYGLKLKARIILIL